MEKISKLLGKPIINIYEGALEGYVKNVLLDEKLDKIVWLEIFDDVSQEEKIVETKNIYNLNEDAIMIKNDEHVYIAETLILKAVNPIGFKVYLSNGKYQDKIADASFDDKLNIQNIYFQNESELDKKSILSIGKNLIIQKAQPNLKISNFRPNKVKLNNALSTGDKVEILQSETMNSTKMPKKILTTGYEFLIGRKVGQNIYTENGGLIAKKQSKITNQIIDVASQNGKLKELTTLSLN